MRFSATLSQGRNHGTNHREGALTAATEEVQEEKEGNQSRGCCGISYEVNFIAIDLTLNRCLHHKVN